MKYFEVKDIEAKGEVKMSSRTITGYFSRFGNVDSDGDMLVPGAFNKTIAERGIDGSQLIKHLTDHRIDTDHIIGLPKLWETQDGAMFETTISDTTKGNDVLKLYRDGVINQHSFGFKTIKNTRKSAYNEINEVFLYEVSTVVLGANSQTPFTGFKGLTKNELIERYNLLEKCYRDGDYTDELFPILKAMQNEVKQQIVNNYIQQETTTEPEHPTTTQPEQVLKSAVDLLIIKNF
jgi:HK97 family phage prohead protease